MVNSLSRSGLVVGVWLAALALIIGGSVALGATLTTSVVLLALGVAPVCVMLLIGFGAIGHAVAKIVRPLGMRVWAVTRSGEGDHELADKIVPVAQLHEALPQADFVILAAPETPETRRMIGAPEFARMKSWAYFMNVSRGALVDEPALIAALEHRTIAGAALDVASQEPLPSDSPLWKLENVFITPHMSAVSDQLWTRQTDLVLTNLERWFSGEELLNRVDLVRGY